MDCSPPGSSVHGILQARMLEWIAILSSGIFPTWQLNPHLPGSPALQVDSLPIESHGKPMVDYTTLHIHCKNQCPLCLGLENLAGRDGTSGNSKQGWLPALEMGLFLPLEYKKRQDLASDSKEIRVGKCMCWGVRGGVQIQFLDVPSETNS